MRATYESAKDAAREATQWLQKNNWIEINEYGNIIFNMEVFDERCLSIFCLFDSNR